MPSHEEFRLVDQKDAALVNMIVHPSICFRSRNPKGTPAGGASPNRKTQERPERLGNRAKSIEIQYFF